MSIPYRIHFAGLGLAIMMMLGPAGAGADTESEMRPPQTAAASNVPGKDTGAAAPAAAPTLQAMHFVTLGRVTFASNKWQLSDSAAHTLDRISAYLMAHPGAERLLLEGHSDSVGPMAVNDRLSDERAKTVETYLVSKGVDPRLIHWKGRGEHAPVDENWTRLGRSRNRQVELYAIYLPQP